MRLRASEFGKVQVAIALIIGMMTVSHSPRRISAREDGPSFLLKETLERGAATQVRIELKADGLFRPGLPPGEVAEEARMPKPLDLQVETRLIFAERVMEVTRNEMVPEGKGTDNKGAAERASKVFRWVVQAASAINGDVRPIASSLRPEVSLLIAHRGEPGAGPVVVSPGGPLSRSELELVQGLADPLMLGDLLPVGSVKRGGTWKVSNPAIQALTGYDALKSSTLEATLETVDNATARIRMKGTVEGSALGGSGTIECDGFLTFNRSAALVDSLELNRTEKRQAGPVEAGLDVKSTLTVKRRLLATSPAQLDDKALAEVSLEITPAKELLLLNSPDGKYRLLHDRQWHIYWDDPRLLVLKRLEAGQVVAQCNLAKGPAASKGKHQDPAQFREDIRAALKQRFVKFIGAGEVDGEPEGGFRYKVAVQGREGEVGVFWYYFLIAGPDGDQLLATFTLAEEQAGRFGEQDLDVVGSLRWNRPGPDRPESP